MRELKMKVLNKIVLTLSLLSLGACATITSGSQQMVAVDTTPVKGAQCTLSNDSGVWNIGQTPGSVTLKRSGSDLSVICEKGHLAGNALVPSSAKAAAFGNILAGGIIGAAVDMGSGSAYDYPSQINVLMKKGQVSSTAQNR